MSNAGKNQNTPAVSGAGVSGQLGLNANTSQLNAMLALVKQVLSNVRTAAIVQVQACTNDSSVEPVGFVDAIPMVNLMDGLGVTYPHGTIYNLAYFRLQGGLGAVIADPMKDDIGLAVICDRDSSVVKNTKAIGNPGSRRRFDLADGIYFPGILNGAPTQYVRFVVDGDGNPAGIEAVDALGNSLKTSADGMNWADKNSNTIVSNSDGITINGVLIDRSQNVSAIQQLTTEDETSLGGGAQAVKLADGSNSTKVKAT